jgi:hypothetical protein
MASEPAAHALPTVGVVPPPAAASVTSAALDIRSSTALAQVVHQIVRCARETLAYSATLDLVSSTLRPIKLVDFVEQTALTAPTPLVPVYQTTALQHMASIRLQIRACRAHRTA